MANPHSGRWKLPDSCWPSRHEGRLKEPCTGEEWGEGGPPKPSVWGGEWHGLITRGCRGSTCGYGNRPEYGGSYVFGSLASAMPDGSPFALGEINFKYLQWSRSFQVQVGLDVDVRTHLGLGWDKSPKIQLEFPDFGYVTDWESIGDTATFLGTFSWTDSLNSLSEVQVIVRTEVWS